MALTHDMSRKSAWLVNANGHRITDMGTGVLAKCPSHHVMQFELREGDGNGGVPSGMPSERAELQVGRRGVYGVFQWWRWVIWFPQDFPTVTGAWGIGGCPGQFHNSGGGGQPPLAFEVLGGRLRLRLANSSGVKDWVYEEPLPRGVETEYRLGYLPHTSPDVGRLILYKNDVKVMDIRRATNFNAEAPYPKAGFYRDASINANFLMRVGGCQVFDADPGPFLPSPPPAPNPEPAPAPVLRVSAAVTNDRRLNTMVTVDAFGKTVTRVQWFIGPVLVAAEVNAPYGDGSPYPIPSTVPAGAQQLRVVANFTDNSTVETAVPVDVPGDAPPPPPPPPPADPLPAIRLELQHAANALTSAAGAITEAMDHIQQANRLASD